MPRVAPDGQPAVAAVMPEPIVPPSPAMPPDPALLAAWLAQSRDLLALTDAAGVIRWCNPAFERGTGLAAAANLLALTSPHDAARARLEAGLRAGHFADSDDKALPLLAAGAAGSGALRWAQVRVTRVGDDRLWTLHDATTAHELAARAQHLSELLDMAQEFGRLGVWEREIPSGAGRWDRHVFSFWGIAPEDGTPDYPLAASHVHEEDRTPYYLESTRQAGRYAQRYRVIQPDGSIRWLHSQWEVKNSAQGAPERVIGIMVDDTEVYELARSRDRAAAQLKLATELIDIVIWRHDLKTDLVHYSEHGARVLGVPYRPQGVPLAEVRASKHPDDATKLADSSAHALATGAPIDVEVRHRRDDGVWRHTLVRRVVERDAAGQPIAFIGVTLDLTEQAEQSRRAEQLARRLEAAVEAARIGIWTTRVGTRETEWNAQMYELFDRVERGPPPTLGEWTALCVHPDDMERVARTTRAFLRRETRAFEVEFRTRMRDGGTRWVMLRADLDRSGIDATRAFGVAMDVTERREALGALHAASERAALIAHHAGIGTWEVDRDGGHALWDEQMWRLRGLEPRALSPTREERLELAHPDDRANVLDARASVVEGPRHTAYEFRTRLPDGSYRWLASRSTTLQDEHGTILRRVGVNWDITEAKNADLARQQALLADRENQAKSQFLSRMSHELRTPLNAVLGFTQLLQLDAQHLPESPQAVRLEYIRAAGEHLLTLIDDALDLSGLQSGTLRLEPQPVPLALAVAQALPLVGAFADRHGVTLHRGALSGTAQADPTRLRQVLLNLLTNAIKYNRAGGQVSVEARPDGDRVRVRVSDNGRGMTPEQVSQLFEPFNRLGMESEGIEGSGIGLTIARALVEGMGGRIEVSSEAGRGTRFDVLLAPAETSAPLITSLEPPAAQRAARSGQLLYIEDNAVNVLLVEELVKSVSGLRIASEPNGAAGVARARALRPDLVLIDMHLPDFDGFEVLRQLRAAPQTANVPCIALSANAMPEDIGRALAAGFDDYWTKPIRFKPFLDALERLFPAAQRG